MIYDYCLQLQIHILYSDAGTGTQEITLPIHFCQFNFYCTLESLEENWKLGSKENDIFPFLYSCQHYPELEGPQYKQVDLEGWNSSFNPRGLKLCLLKYSFLWCLSKNISQNSTEVLRYGMFRWPIPKICELQMQITPYSISWFLGTHPCPFCFPVLRVILHPALTFSVLFTFALAFLSL